MTEENDSVGGAVETATVELYKQCVCWPPVSNKIGLHMHILN